tara:strand:+ start:955 stop:1275 length:321 start_codon:yes stop_codon:yes gene_type:complete
MYETNFKEHCAIILGSEGSGISPAILKVSDEKAKLPLLGNKIFLETDYPRGSPDSYWDIEVPACRLAGFAGFILASGLKTVPKAFGIVFYLTLNCEKAVPTSPKER